MQHKWTLDVCVTRVVATLTEMHVADHAIGAMHGVISRALGGKPSANHVCSHVLTSWCDSDD